MESSEALNEIVLVGSWCLPIYKYLYGDIPSIPVLRTTDIDLLISNPKHIRHPVNIDIILQEIGFDPSFDMYSPLIKYKHNHLDVEFLSQRVRGEEKILKIPELKITAQVLSYMELASKYAMKIDYMGIQLRVPEIPAYVLHKAIVQTRRINEAKQIKDAATVVGLGELIAERQDMKERLSQIFEELPRSWQKIILGMVKVHSQELFGILR